MLLNNPLFREVMDKLRNDCIAVLLASNPGELTSLAAHARMKSLNDIESSFQSITNDEKLALVNKRKK